jgi:hypothetical protein
VLSSLSLLLLMLLLPLLLLPPPWRACRKIRRNLPMPSRASALLQIWSVIHDHKHNATIHSLNEKSQSDVYQAFQSKRAT